MNQIPNIEETEALSEKIHHLYCAQYEKDHGEPYWTNGDYSKLDERTKEYDRNIARFIHHQLQKAREEERRLIRYAIKGVAEKHGGSIKEILQEVVHGLDLIHQAELDQDNK